MGKFYEVNTDFGELTEEMHTARMTGVLVYLAGISPLVRGLQRQTKPHAFGYHWSTPPPPPLLHLDSSFVKHKLPSNLWFPTWLAQDAGNR